jgi:hypothetical protein
MQLHLLVMMALCSSFISYFKWQGICTKTGSSQQTVLPKGNQTLICSPAASSLSSLISSRSTWTTAILMHGQRCDRMRTCMAHGVASLMGHGVLQEIL